MNYVNYILESVWFMGIVLVSVPFVLYSFKYDKRIYWFLAAFFYLYVIIDFLEALLTYISK